MLRFPPAPSVAPSHSSGKAALGSAGSGAETSSVRSDGAPKATASQRRQALGYMPDMGGAPSVSSTSMPRRKTPPLPMSPTPIDRDDIIRAHYESLVLRQSDLIDQVEGDDPNELLVPDDNWTPEETGAAIAAHMQVREPSAEQHALRAQIAQLQGQIDRHQAPSLHAAQETLKETTKLSKDLDSFSQQHARLECLVADGIASASDLDVAAGHLHKGIDHLRPPQLRPEGAAEDWQDDPIPDTRLDAMVAHRDDLGAHRDALGQRTEKAARGMAWLARQMGEIEQDIAARTGESGAAGDHDPLPPEIAEWSRRQYGVRLADVDAEDAAAPGKAAGDA